MAYRKRTKRPKGLTNMDLYNPSIRAHMEVNEIVEAVGWRNMSQVEKCQWFTENGGGYVMAGPSCAIDSNLPYKEKKYAIIDCCQKARQEKISMTEAWYNMFPGR